ncbi:unnamed protein product [Porites lobata]|uniref:MARVEL domain-containing protein n=1 Tax=Porites lobata TaxID=104759 RepID=A0ABN8QEX2_9CNID|nr:unnamed protein product [Porites lobata]
MADPENQDTEKAPSLTKEYIIPGIIKTAEFLLLMIAFSLAADFKGSSSWGRMDFFLFATITSWLLVIARLVSCCCIAFDAILIFKLAIDFTICGDLLVMIFDAVVAVFLLISSSLIADDARRWNDIHGGYRPSGFSAFGFFSMVAFIIEAVFHFMKMRGKM